MALPCAYSNNESDYAHRYKTLYYEKLNYINMLLYGTAFAYYQVRL